MTHCDVCYNDEVRRCLGAGWGFRHKPSPGKLLVKVTFGSSKQNGHCLFQVTVGINHAGHMQDSPYYAFLIISNTLFFPFSISTQDSQFI